MMKKIVIGTGVVFFLILILSLFVIPAEGEKTAFGKALIIGTLLISFVLIVKVLIDRNLSVTFQSIAAFLFLVEVFYLLNAFVSIDFKQLQHIFFNTHVMEGQGQLLLQGLGTTVRLALMAICFSTLGGLFLAILRFLNNKVISALVIAYLNFFRIMPIIVILMFVYAGLPNLNIMLNAEQSGVLVLSLAASASISEVFRSGIEAIHKTQIEASHALGLSNLQTFRLIILPQATKIVIPSLINQWVGTIKDTSICALISVTELLKSAMIINTWKVNPTPLICAAGIYLAILIPLTLIVIWLQNHMNRNLAK